MQAGSKGPRKLDISYPTTEFTKLVKLWDKYNEADMSITVRHIKSYDFLVLGALYSSPDCRSSVPPFRTTSSTRVNDSLDLHLSDPKAARCVETTLSQNRHSRRPPPLCQGYGQVERDVTRCSQQEATVGTARLGHR